MKVSNNNVVLVLGALLCYLVFNRIFLFFVPMELFISIQFLAIFIALTPFSSEFFRFLYGVRMVQTERDKKKLYPLFNEVLKKAKESHSDFSLHADLYIDNSNEINAYAFGSDTIVITRGAVMQLNDEQIKGILAHEVGHIYHGDTFLLMFLGIGNILFLFFIGFFKLVQLFSDLVAGTIGDENMKPRFLNILFGSIATFCMLIIQMFLMINSRTNEYGADHFALEIGYGQQLIDSLYFLSNLQIGQKQSMFERLKASHPNIYDRIEVLENKMKMRGLTV